MKVILLIVFLIGLYAVGTNGFVVGTPGLTSTYNKEIRAESLVTNIVLKSIRNSDGSYVTFSAGYCDGKENSLNLFTPPTGPVLVVFCDQNGEPQILGAPVSNALYTTVDVETSFSAFNPVLPGRSFPYECQDLSPEYETASALDLLLIVDHAKAYRGLGYEEYFLTNDLSGFASRSYHINIYNTSESFPQFNIPAKTLSTASQYLQAPTTPSTWNANLACRHVDAPIKFVSTPIMNYGLDILSDYYGEHLAATTESLTGPTNEGLFPATMTLQDKDATCQNIAGPDYHAATAAQVRMFLKNSVNPTASILTNVYASSDCLGTAGTDFYSLVSSPWGFLNSTGQQTVSNNNIYDYGVRCQPVAFVTADSCEPLTAVSNPPTTSVYDLDDANGVDYPSYNTFTGLPTIRRAQEVIDWCIGATTACNPSSNCLQNASLTVGACTPGAQADSLVASQVASYNINPSARRAIFGHLACTNLPLGRRPAYPTCNIDQPVVCSSTNPPASGVTVSVLTEPNNVYALSSTALNASYLPASGSNLVTLLNVAAFRIEPRRHFTVSNGYTIQFAFPNAVSRNIVIRGCGYDDDCFNYSDLAVDVVSSSASLSEVVFVPQTQCALFVLVDSDAPFESFQVSFVPSVTGP